MRYKPTMRSTRGNNIVSFDMKKEFLGLTIGFVFSLFITLITIDRASAEKIIEFYGGFQTSPHSVVDGEFPVASEIIEKRRFNAGWKGKSFVMPPYYGLRFTSWRKNVGWGLDFTHSKAYLEEKTKAEVGFELLEFTDGLNNLTFHRQEKYYQAQWGSELYYGLGLGVIVPHVEVQVESFSPKTYEYQFGGPSVAFNSGVMAPWGERKYIFSEYKFTASWLNVDLTGGGSMKTLLLTNALNVGLGFQF
ncbi:MAG: lipid A oxidase [Pseudomonadota bacterium]|nr:lipid A oxidase [Pseudomonadota bacterium]